MKSLRPISLLVTFLAILFVSTSEAATAITKVLPAKPFIISTLTGSSDDEISGAISTSNSLIITGTVSGAAGDWVTSPALGGTDGFISSIDFSGVRNWDLRLGGAADEIASSLIKDKSGNYWVLGAGAKTATTSTSPSPTPSLSPSPILNPDGVVVDPSTSSATTLDQLMVWKVSRTGLLLASYSFSAPGTIFPKSISIKGSFFTAVGEVASGGQSKKFTILFDSSGNFSQMILAKLDTTASNPVSNLTAGVNHWRISTSSAPIAGIPSWRPKRALPIAILYNKASKILDARYFSTSPLFFLWQAGVGLVVISEQGIGFGMTIVNPLAG